MKKFLLKIGLFFLIVGIIDLMFGEIFSYLVNQIKGGGIGRSNYICNETHDEILVFGSSRAIRHYNPIIISDSLEMSCYNCGQHGYGIFLNYAYFHLVNQRYYTKLIIYDVFPVFDLLVANQDNHRYLGWLRPYYDKEGVSEIFGDIDIGEKYKMESNLYRFNSNFIQILVEYLHPIDDDINGFRPYHAEMDTTKIGIKDSVHGYSDYICDSLKIVYIEKMLSEANHTKFVFVVSPCWYGEDTIPYQSIKEICQERSIPFIDFSNSPKYVHHNEYFKDGLHLNARGADEFTRDLVHVLKERGLIQQSAEKK